MQSYFGSNRWMSPVSELMPTASQEKTPELSSTARMRPGRPENFHGPALMGISGANHTVYCRPLNVVPAAMH